MASLVFARRFSSKFLNKTSLNGYSSSGENFLVPKISNSLLSIFNRHCNSTTQYSSFENPSKSPADSSPSPQLLLNDSSTYFLAGAKHENPSNLNRRVLCEKFESNHKKYLDQLPKELYNITPEEFRRGTEILLSSMENLRSVYSSQSSYWVFITGLSICMLGKTNIWFGLLFASYYIPKLMEIKSIEKVVLLRNLQKQGNIPIQTAALQLINEVKKSDRRRDGAKVVYRFVVFIMACKLLTLIYS